MDLTITAGSLHAAVEDFFKAISGRIRVQHGEDIPEPAVPSAKDGQLIPASGDDRKKTDTFGISKKPEEHVLSSACDKATPSEPTAKGHPTLNVAYIRFREDVQSPKQHSDSHPAGREADREAPLREINQKDIENLVHGVLHTTSPKESPVSVSVPSGCCHPDHFTSSSAPLQEWTSFALRLTYNTILAGHGAHAVMHSRMQAHFPEGRLVLACLGFDSRVVNIPPNYGQLTPVAHMVVLNPKPSLKAVFIDRPSILLMPISRSSFISKNAPFLYLFELGHHDKHDPMDRKGKPPLRPPSAIEHVFLTEENLIDVSASYLPPKLDEHAPSAYSAMLSSIANRDPTWKACRASDCRLEWMQRFFPSSLFYFHHFPKKDAVIKISRPPMTNFLANEEIIAVESTSGEKLHAITKPVPGVVLNIDELDDSWLLVILLFSDDPVQRDREIYPLQYTNLFKTIFNPPASEDCANLLKVLSYLPNSLADQKKKQVGSKDSVEKQVKEKKKAKRKSYLKRRKEREGSKPDKDTPSIPEDTGHLPVAAPPSPLEKASLAGKSKQTGINRKLGSSSIKRTKPKRDGVSARIKDAADSGDAPPRDASKHKDKALPAPSLAAPLAHSKHSESAFLEASLDLFKMSSLRHASQHSTKHPRQRPRPRWRKSRHTASKAVPPKTTRRSRAAPRKNSPEPKKDGSLVNPQPHHAPVLRGLLTADAGRLHEAQEAAPESQEQAQVQPSVEQNIASASAIDSVSQMTSLETLKCSSPPRSARLCRSNSEYTILDYEKALLDTPTARIPDTLASDPYTAHASMLSKCEGMILRSTLSLYAFIPANRLLYSIVDFKTGKINSVAAPRDLFVDAIRANQDEMVKPDSLLLSYYYVKTSASDPVVDLSTSE